MPKGFIRVENYWDRDIGIYYIWFLVPFVRLWILIKKVWWIIPKWLYRNRRGYFEHQEGEAEHWFWFKKIRLKKTK